jgi:3-isopropylmalate dehydratase small subunit
MNVGTAHVYGDNIDTDRIIPGKYTKTLDLKKMSEHVLEDLDPEFIKKVKPGDVLVAGENFGCGSSREQAPVALKHAGVGAVIARSFARIFFRNAINIGLPLIEIPSHQISNGSQLEFALGDGKVIDKTNNFVYQSSKMPDVMIEILNKGGLVQYLKENGKYQL